MPPKGVGFADPLSGTLKGMTAKLGAPKKTEGKEAVRGKDAPALHFAGAKINNKFEIVDAKRR
jgi:hypothetical protein